MGVGTFQRARLRKEKENERNAKTSEETSTNEGRQQGHKGLLTCPKCGKECKNLLGYNKHVASHKE